MVEVIIWAGGDIDTIDIDEAEAGVTDDGGTVGGGSGGGGGGGGGIPVTHEQDEIEEEPGPDVDPIGQAHSHPTMTRTSFITP